jgi:hypothetical protein
MIWTRILLWIGTIAMMVVLFQMSSPLREAGVASVEHFEMSQRTEAVSILNAWTDHKLIDIVRSVIYADYIFILFYVPLMIVCSRDQLKIETNGFLCMLLMLNTPLAILTGILDVIENQLMINNINDINNHISTKTISIVKFTAAGLVILVWLFVLIRRKVLAKPDRAIKLL